MREFEDAEGQPAQKYYELGLLGRGGSAVVKLAVTRNVGGVDKLVVLKGLREECGGDEELIQMFLQEARLSARMNHRNVVQTYEVIQHNGLPHLVLEYLFGQSFERALRPPSTEEAEPLTLAMRLYVLRCALAGLEYAHGLSDYDGTPLNVIHRDVSPHNIFICYDGQVKLLDFGIATLNAPRFETETGVVKGKITYMAPEQADLAGLDQRADIFAMGICLWEVLSGKRMWEGLSDAQIIGKLIGGGIPSAEGICEYPRLTEICAKAIQADPEERYASVREFRAALESACTELGLQCGPDDIADRMQTLFRDAKSQSEGSVGQQLAALRAGGPTALTQGLEQLVDTTGQEYSADGYSTAMTVITKEPRRPRWGVALVALLITGAPVGVLLNSSETDTEGASRPGERAPATAFASTTATSDGTRTGERSAPSAPPAKARTEIGLSIRTTPANAEIFLDGKRLASSPYDGSMPQDDQEHELRISAPGYQEKTRTVSFAKDLALSLELQRVAPKPRPKPAKRSIRVRRPKAPPKADSCSPNWYVDAEGVKHFKLHCL